MLNENELLCLDAALFIEEQSRKIEELSHDRDVWLAGYHVLGCTGCDILKQQFCEHGKALMNTARPGSVK